MTIDSTKPATRSASNGLGADRLPGRAQLALGVLLLVVLVAELTFPDVVTRAG
jgi:hypothetical protein